MRNKVLLVVESCNPELSSVPLVGYNFARIIQRFSDVHLVTHCRNREALKRDGLIENITYYEQSWLEVIYYKFLVFFSTYRGQVIWPLRHALQYPIYFFFNRFVYRKFSLAVMRGEYDIVHAMTPMMPRFPYKIVNACKRGKQKTIFILGPVNGGVPFPKAFKHVARKEFSFLNWLRSVGGWIIPGYRKTYLSADAILTGSKYTNTWIKDTFKISKSRLIPVYENGVSDEFYSNIDVTSFTNDQNPYDTHEVSIRDVSEENSVLSLLFIGRLEPYKGCDMLLQAVQRVRDRKPGRIKLTIVGDGSQRKQLEHFVQVNDLTNDVLFRGWIPHSAVPQEYASAELFCFPSVREFGGAVVMEAMASGLPCIVVDNGGIGEYVTESSGVKIAPISREHVIEELMASILEFTENRKLLKELSNGARARAVDFSWSSKRTALEKIYNELSIQLESGEATLAGSG
ncbi:glycosyltransferase family 4 protein [Microbulbifer bruguierae]|uniref:Glycosyltransferase family 4 protein n=1 Tax=Microbulbifer bruguierae TaxID=3029061 RepID=A0ABY8N9D2_9GAMM|nr:glycosyltransferase family 4 protein [Microbulbifer bruguierae]WGL15250.1 glycosyltransferase family 4 protein [Microbulbifer bruguierae]